MIKFSNSKKDKFQKRNEKFKLLKFLQFLK